jgi:quercetin dioxygenase-like cupin family protein
MRVITVHFSDGARTHWHAHAGGQVLHVIEGDGRVQSWGGEVHSIGPGDTVSAEPGEKHWHGAARGTSMAHLAVSIGAVTWMEPPDE